MGKKEKFTGHMPPKQEQKNKNIAAVIDIGSNAIRLKIAQKTKGKVHVLEELRYPLSLGADTFSVGRIELETIHKLCQVLTGFLTVIAQYQVETVRAIATTALREAANKDHVVDIILTRTGLNVEILNGVDEKSYIYRAISKRIEESESKLDDCLLAYIGIGNLGVSYYKNGRFPFMHSLRLGSLRLSELFEDVLDYSDNFFDVVDEYQYSVIDDLRILMPDYKPGAFIACGSEVMFIASICGATQQDDFMYIPRDSFLTQFDIIKAKTYAQLMEDYNITESKAEILFPFMSMCKTLLSLTSAEEIIMPLIYLRDSVLYEELFAKDMEKERERFDENIITGAISMAERYGADMRHARRVSQFALKIFSRLRKDFGFTKRDGLLLQAAAIMHDIGKYINIKHHDDHAYTIIRGSDISGLNPEETEFVACLTKFNGKMPAPDDPHYQSLPYERRVMATKLASIMGIAETLDRSHAQKFDDIEVKLEEDQLIIMITTYKDILLEEWAFKKKAGSFEEIFGIKAVLRRKRVF